MKRFTILILLAVTILAGGVATYLASAENSHESSHSQSSTINGPLSNATVSFGAWIMPLDRQNALPPPSANHHQLIPHIAKIKAGGSVNFIIAGLHQVIVYDDGTQPGDINTALTIPGSAGPPPLPALVDDPDGRIYRGPDPRPLLPTLERVEVVHFPTPGTYLVICGVLPHFNQGMYGFVTVLP